MTESTSGALLKEEDLQRMIDTNGKDVALARLSIIPNLHIPSFAGLDMEAVSQDIRSRNFPLGDPPKTFSDKLLSAGCWILGFMTFGITAAILLHLFGVIP